MEDHPIITYLARRNGEDEASWRKNQHLKEEYIFLPLSLIKMYRSSFA